MSSRALRAWRSPQLVLPVDLEEGYGSCGRFCGTSSPHYSARREKVQCSCRCKSGLGELSVRPSSYRGSKEGD